MSVLDTAVNALWMLNVAVQLGLLFLLVSRKEVARFPAFTVYLTVNLLQSAIFALIIPNWGSTSWLAWRVAWITQAVVVAARAFVIAELCYQVLGRYRGIWAMGWRLLAAIGLSVLAVALILGNHELRVVVLTLDLGTELAIAAVIAFLFIFARHYAVEVEQPMRTMGITFCFYSCAVVVDDLLMQHYWREYQRIWNVTEMGTFLLILACWAWAFWAPIRASEQAPTLLDADVYRSMIPEMNRRLARLNEELAAFWNTESRRT